MSVKNQTKALAWLEMSEGVKWVANGLRVHLTTIGRLTLKIQTAPVPMIVIQL